MDYGKYFPIAEYYKKVVVPLDKKFLNNKNDKFICCLHNDKDPSLGVINKKGKGEVFHCFGCGAWGDIIELHKKVSLIYFKKSLDTDLCKRELCEIFNIDYLSLPKDEFSVGVDTDREIRKQLAIQKSLEDFSLLDFRNSFIEGKIEGKPVSYFNTLLVRMLDKENRDRE